MDRDDTTKGESDADAALRTSDTEPTGTKVENRPANDAEPKQDQNEKPNTPSLWRKIQSHLLAISLILLAVVVASGASLVWWLQTHDYESTDDAFIDGRPIPISALVAGTLTGVDVTDNQLVPAGTILARTDDRDYAAAQAEARAQLAQAQAGVAIIAAQVETQQARIEEAATQITEAQAALSLSSEENGRYRDLAQQGAGSVQRAQEAGSDFDSKRAALDATRAANMQATKQLDVLKAQRVNAEAQIDMAQAQSDLAAANLSRVVMNAPVEGRITKLTAAPGAYATSGQTLMILVPTDLWVTANFKETQLATMRPGQPVTIEIDAYGRSFPGHVDSIQAGSGDAFSLLPAENATGNYVKVVQRIPVKIVFDVKPDVAIGPGMSVVPSVKVQ